MLILRYRNFEAATLEQHREVLDAKGGVMWGWWKKSHEPFDAELLDRAQRALAREPVRIGLVARADDEYAVAVCTRVDYGDGETELPSPDPIYTPTYYADERCAAWFFFTDIRRVPRNEWESEFGPTPSGNPTIFPARRERPSAYPAEVVNADAREGQSGVLHISDLHFGSGHGFGRAYRHGGGSMSDLADRILESLMELDLHPAVLVISGDLTTNGSSEELVQARRFLCEMSDRLEMERQAVILTPGNSDIRVENPELTRDYQNEDLFRDQLQLFYNRETDLERVHDVRDPEGRHYIIGALNSSRPHTKETMNYGYVGKDRSEPVFHTIALCRSLARFEAWSAVVLHHHVLPGPLNDDQHPRNMSIDAGELISLARQHGVHAILHGHQHVPFVGEVARLAECNFEGAQSHPLHRVSVLGAGSAGAAIGQIPDSIGENSYSFYEPFDSLGFLASCYGYRARRRVESRWHFHM